MRKGQSGVFLIGATIAVAVAGTLMTLWMNQRMQEMRIQRAENIASALKATGDSVQSFIVQYHDEIDKALSDNRSVSLNGTGTLSNVTLSRTSDGSGYQLRIGAGGVTSAPSASQIVQIMKLPGVGDKPPLPNANYVIRIYREAQSANIHALINLDQTLRKTYEDAPDWNMLGAAVRKIGVNGGLSKDDKGQFTFPLTPSGVVQVSNELPNPSGTPGLLAVRAGYLLDPLNRYLRRDGSQPMTGDLNMGGKALVGLSQIRGEAQKLELVGNVATTGTLTVSGDIETQGKLDVMGNLLAKRDLTALGNVDALGSIAAGKDVHASHDMTAGNNVTASNDVRAQRNMSAAGEITANRLVAGAQNGYEASSLDEQTLSLGKSVAPGDCKAKGQVGRDKNGMFYFCNGQRWATLKGDRGSTGPRGGGGVQGDKGDTGARGEKGDEVQPNNGWVTVYSSSECDKTTTIYAPVGHDFCALGSFNQHACSNNAGYTYAEVSPVSEIATGPNQKQYDLSGKALSTKSSYGNGVFWGSRWSSGYWFYTRPDASRPKNKIIYALSLYKAAATMICYDFN